MAGKKTLACRVLLLDDRSVTLIVSAKAFGQELYEAVHRELQLVETDYFGLEYKAVDDVDSWLVKHKPLILQIGSRQNLLFKFKVKFYPADPTVLEEEFTRYLFALQIRQDLATGRLQCSVATATLLAAYIVQSEFGDYAVAASDNGGDSAYLKSICLVPNQTEELERRVAEVHRSLIGQTPSDADFNLLDTARKTDFYGVVLNSVKDVEGVPQSLAVTESGVHVFQNNQRVNTFSWAKIRKLSFRRKMFLVKLYPAADKAHPSNVVEFIFASRNRSKTFWKTCVEHHAFFQCREAPFHQPQYPRRHVLTHGSSFRYSGRTQTQLIDHVKDNLVKSRPFVRMLSLGTMGSSRSYGGASLSAVLSSAQRVTPLSTAAANANSLDRSTFSGGSHALHEDISGSDQSMTARESQRSEAATTHVLLASVSVGALESGANSSQRGTGSGDDSQSSASTAIAVHKVTVSQPSQKMRWEEPEVDTQPLGSAVATIDLDELSEKGDAASDDSGILAQLEDAIQSLAAGGEAGNSEVAADDDLRRNLAVAEVERAARQQTSDEVLVACRASSLRRSLRRSSSRSADEEMAQLEDLSDLAAKVMHDYHGVTGQEVAASSDDTSSVPVGMGLSGQGQVRRLSSLQDLCELASMVMQYDVSSPSAEIHPPLEDIAAERSECALLAAAAVAEVEIRSPSPPPLPVKQHDTAHASATPLSSANVHDLTYLAYEREAAEDESLQAPPPLPPKCSDASNSLPRDLFEADCGRVRRSASLENAWPPGFENDRGDAAILSIVAPEREIRLPLRRGAKRGESSSCSDSSSSSASSLSDAYVNSTSDAAFCPANVTIIANANVPALRGSAAIDDELDEALAAAEQSSGVKIGYLETRQPSFVSPATEPAVHIVPATSTENAAPLRLPPRYVPPVGRQLTVGSDDVFSYQPSPFDLASELIYGVNEDQDNGICEMSSSDSDNETQSFRSPCTVGCVLSNPLAE